MSEKVLEGVKYSAQITDNPDGSINVITSSEETRKVKSPLELVQRIGREKIWHVGRISVGLVGSLLGAGKFGIDATNTLGSMATPGASISLDLGGPAILGISYFWIVVGGMRSLTKLEALEEELQPRIISNSQTQEI
jgi:hypothetical protein